MLALVLSLLFAVPAMAATIEVDIPDFVYDPPQVSIEVGDSVTWTNNHFEPHTVTADDGSYDYWLDPGDTVTHTYTDEAYEPYFCVLHGAPGGLGMAGAVLVGDVEAPPPPDVTPLEAADNVGAAIAWSQRNFPDGAETALLGRHDLFADSLSSGGVQGLLDAPLLLTPSDNLNARTRNELRRLGVSRVVLFGGVAALGPEVAESLREDGYELSRMQGPNRVATAVNAASRLFPEASSVVLARAFGDAGDESRAFADSLAAGALAAITRQPVVLTATRELSAETRDYLVQQAITDVTIVGGAAAVSAEVEAELAALGIAVERASGPNRFATAIAVFDLIGPRAVLTVIDGEAPNAWAAGFPAASAGYPVLLTQQNNLPAETLDSVVGWGQEGVQILCGPFLADRVCERATVASSATGFFSPGARHFVLEGQQEVGGGNDEASGMGAVYPTSDPGTICYEYELGGGDIGELTAAHIHSGARGANGPPVITLSTEIERSAHGVLRACAFDQDAGLVSNVLNNHAEYYVNLHTTEFPDGALRGQLFQLTNVAITFTSGDQETAGGDPEGEGFAAVIFPDYPGEICVIMFHGVSSPTTAAHIHEGAEGEDGPPVVTLRTPPQFGGDMGCYEVDQALIDDLGENSADYYINIHTEDYPAGAIRGQLG